MRRCAGAIALAELAPGDADVVRILGEALKDATQPLAGYVLDAFDAIGSPSAVPYVMPLLDSDEVAVKLRAMSIMAKGGGRVVPLIIERLGKAGRSEKVALADVLARVANRESFRAILNLLPDPDFELVKETCEAVHRHMAAISPKDRAALHKETAAFMKTGPAKSSERVLTSCLLLLGYIGIPQARQTLINYSSPKTSLYVRRHALIGLKNLQLTGAAVSAVGRKVFTYLDDADDGIVRHALDIIERLPPAGLSAAQWRRLRESKNNAVRAFATRKLAVDDTAANNKELLALLGHEDPTVQEIAASALASHKNAAPLLLNALAREKKTESAWRLAKILKPHGEAINRARLKSLSDIARRDMKAGNDKHEALLYLVRNVDQKAADALVREAGLEHKRAQRWARAVDCLKRLINTESFDEQTRYDLSICNLKLVPKDIAPQMGTEDHAIRGFRALLHSGSFKLFDTLKKDKTLDASDLHYVGVRLVEAMGDGNELGVQLLEHVAKRWPKSEQGKAAKNRLKLLNASAGSK